MVMVLVIAPTEQIAYNVAEIDYKLSRREWRRVRDMSDVRGFSSKDTTYIWAWPTGYDLRIGNTDARQIENYLIATGFREHSK